MRLHAVIDYGGASFASWMAWEAVAWISPILAVFAAILGFGLGLYLARRWRLDNL